MRLFVYSLFSSIVGFSLFWVITQPHTARLRSLFFPQRYTIPLTTPRPENPDRPFFYGVNVDMSQILPTSQHYIINEAGEDLIDIAERLGITLLRITNNTKSFDSRTDGLYTEKEWKSVLDKMQEKHIKALIVIETASDNPNLYARTIHQDYLQQAQDYIIESKLLFHPDVYGIDLKNEPVLNEHNISMIREAARIIKTVNPKILLTVGWWGIDTKRNDEDGQPIIYWEDFAAGRKLDDFVDFYSLHIYGFDKSTIGIRPDAYTYTKQYIMDVKRELRSTKPLIVEEFGAANGLAVSDQETVGSRELQANAYAGVYQAITDLDDPQIIGAVSFQFHSQSDSPDAWSIATNKGNSLLPAAYVLQTYAIGESEQAIAIPMEPVPKDHLYDNDAQGKTIRIHPNDVIGFSLALRRLSRYRATVSNEAVLRISQPVTYNEKFGRFHAVFHAQEKGKAQITVERLPDCKDAGSCDGTVEQVFSLRFVVEP